VDDRVSFREATTEDVEALTAALLDAVNWSGQARLSRQGLRADPHLSRYVEGWPRSTDFGTVAAVGNDVIGAAWCRTFTVDEPGYGFIAADIPELSMGVQQAYRGRGIGSALLDALIAQAGTRRCRALSLSVEDGNRARSLYRRAGFAAVGRNGNSDTMRLELTAPGVQIELKQ
jgi:ribosomal protein S18 acetylase RimI-like enzyme